MFVFKVTPLKSFFAQQLSDFDLISYIISIC